MIRAAVSGAATVVAALALLGPALADGASLCIDASLARGPIAEKGGRWAQVTPEQYHFLQGIYAMNPRTPAGLPYGDRAVLATAPGHDGALVLFIDGDLACTPMPVPHELVDMLRDVATGKIGHEGTSN